MRNLVFNFQAFWPNEKYLKDIYEKKLKIIQKCHMSISLLLKECFDNYTMYWKCYYKHFKYLWLFVYELQ